MSTEPTDEPEEEKAARLKLEDNWDKAVHISPIEGDGVERALIFGVNVRVSFPEAFIAAYKAIEAGHLIAASMATHVDWPIAIWKTYRAASSVFSALIEKIPVEAYVTAMILSLEKEAIEQTALKAKVAAFLNEPNTKEFGWWAGLSSANVEDTRKALQANPKWFEQTLVVLKTNKFLTQEGTEVKYTPKNVEWNWRL